MHVLGHLVVALAIIIAAMIVAFAYRFTPVVAHEFVNQMKVLALHLQFVTGVPSFRVGREPDCANWHNFRRRERSHHPSCLESEQRGVWQKAGEMAPEVF